MGIKIDINCDMGESFGLYKIGNDETIMNYVSSINVACGYHAGDPHVMRKTVELAKEHGIAIGAHPGFPDMIGFGRRRMLISEQEIKDYITYQMGALREFASISGLKLQHCKPHGQLYMWAMSDATVAKAILEAIAEINPETIVFALEHSEVTEIGRQMGIPIAKEGYADCEHTDAGSIVPIRTHAAAGDPDERAKRVVRMVTEKKVISDAGNDLDIDCQTICVHGDTPGADVTVKKIADALKAAGVEIAPVSSFM